MDGVLSQPVVTGGGPNGLTEGKDGVLYVAQNGGKHPAHKWPGITGGVQRISAGGTVDYLTQDPVSASDICMGPDGLLYVTDPTRTAARDDGRIWRCDPESGEAEILISVAWQPNGIGFSLEKDALYVADTRHCRIVRYTLSGGRLSHEEDFARLPHNVPDGFCFDVDGNLIIAAVNFQAAGDLQVYDRNGHFLESCYLGDDPFYTNVALSADRRLFITNASGGGVLVIDDWPTAGLPLNPFRS
jgi:gluconolactonase